MPELPEVETIRRGLEKYLVGKKIVSIEIRFPKIFTGNPEDVIGKEVINVRRFGKGLVIDFENELSMVAHVKMTGQFIFLHNASKINLHPKLDIVGNLPNKWTHVIFSLDAGKLFYNDIRKFGWLKIVQTSQVEELAFFKSLGLELPVVKTENILSKEAFFVLLQASSSPIKTLVMDQQKIAGVGNIYANEALFLSKIHPLQSAKSISQKSADILYSFLIQVMQKAVSLGGSSDVNYLNVEGGKGEFQNHFLVYGKNGKPCPVCKEAIVRIVVGGRGTFVCPACQPLRL